MTRVIPSTNAHGKPVLFNSKRGKRHSEWNRQKIQFPPQRPVNKKLCKIICTVTDQTATNIPDTILKDVSTGVVTSLSKLKQKIRSGDYGYFNAGLLLEIDESKQVETEEEKQFHSKPVPKTVQKVENYLVGAKTTPTQIPKHR